MDIANRAHTPSGKVLVVDDDKDVLLTAELVLKNSNELVRCLTNPSELPKVLAQEKFDVVLLDMNFTRGMTNGAEGIYWLNKITQASEYTQVVMSTAYGEIDLAVEAIKQGAADFLIKPWDNEKLVSTINNCVKLSRSQQEVKHLKNTQQALNETLESGFGDVIGESDAMQKVFKLVEKVAGTEANVLILGENGTGKELVARAIHRQSSRKQSPLITVDLGAINDNLFESEMFGHKKGAFTDAREDRAGRFEVADGGTLFLDEIGNLSLPMQAKLLGALETRCISRVGSDAAIRVDIRLISATNASREDLANDKKFRTDLLYRINTVEIQLPPLRERATDIPLLVDYYVKLYSNKYNKPGININKEGMARLQKYSWPGNIRELQHALERAVIVADNEKINITDLLTGQNAKSSEGKEELNISRLEQQAIQQAIAKYQGNLTQVAKALGLGRTTLYRKMEKYELTD